MSDKKRTIFEETLTQAYSYESYRRFLGELLNHVQFKPQIAEEPYSTFSVAIKNYVHIGDYEGGDHQKIALFSVCLKNDKSIENARSMQRAFVKSLLEASNSAGALVAFYTDADPGRWRLSMVRMDYGFTDGKISVELTPARRYSYLVGEGEPCHTAKERLYPIFAEDDIDPGLDDLEEAFSVEAVTKEFFAQYREKYLSVKEFLEHNTDFVREAGSRGFNSEQFAKKLMGQLVFLYFIQKKGWLGVNAFPKTLSERAYKDAFYQPGQKPKELMPHVYRRNEAGEIRLDASALRALSDDDEIALSKIVQGGAWGDGPKDFMRQLFNDCRKRGKNFFDDYLEPLFYEGLNQNRGDQAFFLPLHSRIPFLNGGLFEELEGYDWKNNDFCIPDELFSNADENGRDADGILDVFDRYNFTMVEDEPMEREVAVDPEMLGKVFENLLDVKDRKSKGAFYTPREIVHYMCQESLICYLSHKTGIADGDIRKFILYGEYFREEDIKKTKPVYKDGKKHHMVFDKDKVLEIPETIFSYRKDVNRLQEMDNLLANVRVLDPAVGSGAFPLGMLTEIVKARETLTAYMGIELNKFQRYALYSDRRTYRLKRETIKNSIFACDLEASAADITKLRLWLSLVIDDQIRAKENEEFGEMTKPRELPNLDCNIICGNSLVDAFHGIKLITENSALGNLSAIGQGALLYDEHFTTQIHRLMSMQDRLYDEKTRVEKERIKKEIQEIYDETILTNLNGSQQAMNAYYECKNDVTKPFILWQLMFPKVFRDNGGFDIVIGNPPYIQLQTKIDENTGEKLGDQFAELGFQTFAKTGDIYCLFYEKGYQLLSLGGVLTYITSNKWMRAGYGEKLRSFFAEKTNPLRLIDFGKQKIFASATVDVNILMFTKSENEERTLACTVGESCSSNLSVYIEQNSCRTSFSSNESWVILSSEEHHIRNKINTYGVPLKEWDVKIYRGILTGFNDAFIISSEKKDELIAADPKSAELIRPILRGRDVKRYGFSFSDLWLITTHNGIKSKNIPPVHVEDYPAIHKHLDEYYPQLAKRADKGDTPYNLRNCVYMNEFFKQKIVYREISDNMNACMVESGIMLNNKCYIITGDHLIYILSFLNSKIFAKIILPEVNAVGGKGEAFLSKISLVRPSTEMEERLHALYHKRMEGNSALDEEEIDRCVDEIFCSLYELSGEERQYILL